MNILYVHRTRGREAEGRHIREMVLALRDLGHTVRVVSVPGADPFVQAEPSGRHRAWMPAVWHYLGSHAPQVVFESWELMYNVLLYCQCWRAHRDAAVDVIYERYALNTFATTLFGRTMGIPIVLEINDATGIRRSRRHTMEFVARGIESWVFSRASHLLTISSVFHRLLLARGIPPAKCSFQPNAANVDSFRADRATREKRKAALGLGDRVVIGFVGSFASWHGIGLLREAIPEVLAHAAKAHFVLVGDGVERAGLEAWVRRQRLERHVTFTGRVPAERVPELVAAMDIGVIPDSNDYGSPMKLFEYLAMGTVPVVPGLPPICEVVRDGHTASIFPAGNGKEMAKGLIELAGDDLRREAMSAAGIELIHARHTWKHNAQRVLEVFRTLSA